MDLTATENCICLCSSFAVTENSDMEDGYVLWTRESKKDFTEYDTKRGANDCTNIWKKTYRKE